MCIEKERFQSFLIFSSVILILTQADPIRVGICQCDIGVTWSRIGSSTERMWLFCQTPAGTGVILSASGLSSMQVVSVHELLYYKGQLRFLILCVIIFPWCLSLTPILKFSQLNCIFTDSNCRYPPIFLMPHVYF